MASSRKTDQLNRELRSMRGSAGVSYGSGSSRRSQPSRSRTQTEKSAKSSSRAKTVRTVEEKEPARRSWGPAASISTGVLTGLLLELCLFQLFGTFGGWISYGLFGLFGSMAYIFPILAGLLIGFSGMNVRKGRLIFFSIFLFLLLCTFAHLTSRFSLNNHDVLSYFKSCADSRSGGGILGGAVALALYLLLSKTGAVIITVLLLLMCIFFLFEDPIKGFLSYFFSRDYDLGDEDYEEEGYDEFDERMERKMARKRERMLEKEQRARERMQERDLRRQTRWIDRDDEDEEEENTFDERYIKRVDDYRRSRTGRDTRQVIYDDPVVIEKHDEETVIRIVKKKKKDQDIPAHDVPMTRSKRKAQPMRDPNASAASAQRSSRKVRGISDQTDLKPQNANGDEIHEITQKKNQMAPEKVSKRGREFFDETLIKPSEEDTQFNQLEWNVPPEAVVFDPNEAAVTSVTQAAVNRRAKEARPVKTRKQDASAQTPVQAGPESPERHEEPARPQHSARPIPYRKPPMDLLAKVRQKSQSSEAELEKIADDLELILEQFGVHATVTDIQAGPSVTRFELQPELGTRVNRITSLADDLKLNLGVTEIRIEAPIPGRQAVGIEIPNKNRQTVFMRELLEEPALVNHPSKIAFAAGKDISGNVVVADIAKMPHLLVAGTTGSGKSVFLNTILMTILFRASPAEVGLIIVDPKKVEFGIYAGIPHLMKEVVTDPSQAVSTLRWAVSEMTTRYQRMQLSSVRDFKSYNAKVEKGTVSPKEENPRKMNQIVIIIDELADLMMVAKKEAEALICRLAQLARAAGIHLIIATQRPSVDVVTGLIKANVPARVALLVSSQIDSRTIIDMPGAEKLLGNGDMLFYPTGYQKPVRVQGAFVSDDEIQQTVDYLIRNNNQNYFAAEAEEIEKFMNSQGGEDGAASGEKEGDSGSQYDEFFYEAGKLCIEMGKASSSMLQRRFNLGFNRAARIIDQLQEFGAVGPQQGAKPREILVDLVTFEEMYRSMKNT